MHQTQFIERLTKRSQKDLYIIAIEGLCGSGKSVLAQKIYQRFGGIVIHMDDFCLPINQRRDEIAGHIDFQRFQDEILTPLSEGKDLNYHIFDCQHQTYHLCHQAYSPLVIIEGSYCMHPCLQVDYDVRCFVETDEEIRMQRLKEREKDYFETFVAVWQKKEMDYHQAYFISQHCNVLIKG